MILSELLLSSNMVKMAVTFSSGGGLYLLVKKYPLVFYIIGYLLSFGIVISFLFNIGEVYAYSIFYKRAFFFFGDGITTILALFFVHGVLSSKNTLAVLTAGSIFMSGGKISLILLFLMILALVLLNKGNDQHILLAFFKHILFGLLLYGVMLCLSGIVPLLNITVSEQENAMRGHGSCTTISRAFKSQIKKPFLQRYYTSVAGLWMTLEGGFHGARYSSPEAFADLMMEKDPWGMNEKYGLTWADWKRMGAPQNPYLRFGSRYGPWLLCVAVLWLLFIGWLAFQNLLAGEAVPAAVFSLYFIVNILFNQTQVWLQGFSRILATLGFCAFHIFNVWLWRRYRLPAFFRPIDTRQTRL